MILDSKAARPPNSRGVEAVQVIIEPGAALRDAGPLTMKTLTFLDELGLRSPNLGP